MYAHTLKFHSKFQVLSHSSFAQRFSFAHIAHIGRASNKYSSIILKSFGFKNVFQHLISWKLSMCCVCVRAGEQPYSIELWISINENRMQSLFELILQSSSSVLHTFSLYVSLFSPPSFFSTFPFPPFSLYYSLPSFLSLVQSDWIWPYRKSSRCKRFKRHFTIPSHQHTYTTHKQWKWLCGTIAECSR